MALRYDMGNAGDLLKHGVLAEFVRWQCEWKRSFRFFDLFGGEPWEKSAKPEVMKRVLALPESIALRAAQKDIRTGRYYGSGHVVRNIAESVGKRSVCILVNDNCPARRERLDESGLLLLDTDPDEEHDGYKVFERIALGKNDLVLIDPFSEFLKSQADTVIPQMAKATERGAAVLLFALNLDPCNPVGQKFENLLKEHLPEAWRMTFPPLRFTRISGESKFHAEVVLATPDLQDEDDPGVFELRKRLEKLAAHLAKIPAQQLKPQVVHRTTHQE